MKKTNICPKCGSKDIVSGAKTSPGYNGTTSVVVFNRPDALLFRGKQSSTVSNWVCTDCGYLESYADNPSDLKLLNR
jgi:predicted nucleic-acid-binding Zn-ribbon protein